MVGLSVVCTRHGKLLILQEGAAMAISPPPPAPAPRPSSRAGSDAFATLGWGWGGAGADKRAALQELLKETKSRLSQCQYDQLREIFKRLKQPSARCVTGAFGPCYAVGLPSSPEYRDFVAHPEYF